MCIGQQDCSGNGECIDGVCACFILYYGDDCSSDPRQDHTFLLYAYAYIGIGIVIHLALALWAFIICAQHVYQSLSKHKDPFATTSFIGLVLVMFASISRIVYLSVDPHNIWNFVSVPIDAALFWMFIFFWCVACDVVFIYWIELILMFGKNRLHTGRLNRLRPVLVVLTIVQALVLFGVGIWRGLEYDFRTALVSNGLIIGSIILIIIVSLCSGIKLVSVIKGISVAIMGPVTRRFLQKVTYLMMLQVPALILVIVSVTVWVFLAPKSIAFLLWQLAFRIEEGLVSLPLIYFLGKGQSNNKLGQQLSGIEPTLASEEQQGLIRNHHRSINHTN